MACKCHKRCSSQHEEETNQLSEENARLWNTFDEVFCQKEAPSDSQNNHLLDRIIALVTLREKNSQQILARDQAITSLWLQSDSAEVVTSLCTQINQQKADAEMREGLFLALCQETEEVKNKLAAMSAKCHVLENTKKSGTSDGHTATGNTTFLIHEQLKDALEKNLEWLIYDQQRETYVKALLAETYQLKQELHQANKALRHKEKEVDLSGEEERDVAQQQCFEKLLGKLEREQQKGKQLLNEHQQIRRELKEERLKSAQLEQQIQLSAKDLEDKKCDNQHLQWQLHKVLKELQKSMEKVAMLESEMVMDVQRMEAGTQDTMSK